MNNSIKHIKHKNIDKTKWDQLVESANNSFVFNFSWYLDKMCEWDAIILGDYDGAIPLPNQVIYSLKKVYQPSFVQKSNWLGLEPNGEWESVVLSILKKQYNTFHFNTDFNLLGKPSNRINLILKLTDYVDIKSAYSKSLKRNLKRSSHLLSINEDLEPENTVRLYQQAHGKNNPQLQHLQYTRICKLVKSHPSYFKCINVTDGGETVASILLACHNKRMHYILGAPSELGKKHNALSIAINYVIESNCETYQVFDFEGSVIPSVKEFYKRFGTQTEFFYENLFLPAYLKPLQWIYKRLLKS